MKFSSLILIFILMVGCLGPIGPEERIKSFYKELSKVSQIIHLSIFPSENMGLSKFN